MPQTVETNSYLGFTEWRRRVQKLCKDNNLPPLSIVLERDAFDDGVTPDEFFEVDVREFNEGRK